MKRSRCRLRAVGLMLVRSTLALAAMTCGMVSGRAGEFISGMAADGRFPLVGERAADLHVEGDDWEVVRIAVDDLAGDIERVTGKRPTVSNTVSGLSSEAVLVGTIGRSAVIDKLVQAGRLDVTDVRGQWESFVVASVAHPLPGVERALVIAGSDRRGTAYGVYELSKRIGVSPWYWWADVSPRHREALHVSPERLHVGPPAVKYRGIFINDEMWGIRPWAHGTLAPQEGEGLGPTAYAKIFELLLRLRANYIWPAMHLDTIPFNYYEENRVVADDYAIVMGSSHIEPMLRNNMHGAEWDREGGGDWNYLTNRDAIYDYWDRRVETNGRYENIYTIGMRGKDDEAMTGGRTREDKISLLERIFRDQREILARHVDPEPARVPQVFIPYTEVLGLYDAGMQVPEDVIICWPDDNFGYIRRLPTAAEQKRPGGSGIYYHIQWLNGATTAYTWLNTTPLPLIFAEMHKAWQYNARSLWVLNVGDIKPGEIGTEFFLDMAWNPERWRHDNVRDYLVQWARRDLDPRFAEMIADIMEEHFRLGFTRRPEHLVQFRRKEALKYSWFSHDQHNDEAGQRLERYAHLAMRARALYKRMPDERKDAFFQLVLYPVECAALMNEKVICADKSMRHAAGGHSCARDYAVRAREAAERIMALTAHYNTGLVTAGDKWKHMVSWAPGPWGNQRHQFEMPPLSDFDGLGPPNLAVSCEGGRGGVLADLSAYTRGKRFIDLHNTGKGEIAWKAEPTHPWVKIDQGSGHFTTEQRLWVRIDWEHAPVGGSEEVAIVIESNGGSHRVVVPVFHPDGPDREDVRGFVESHGCVSMEAEHFTRCRDREGTTWKVIGGLGRSGDSVTVFPATVASRTEASAIRSHSPSLEYDMHVFSSGEFALHLDCLPTQSVAPGRGVRLAVSVDGGAPRVLDGTFRGDVMTNLRRCTTTVAIEKPGHHTLCVWMVDPGVILDKIVLHTMEPKESYSGPPESYRR